MATNNDNEAVVPVAWRVLLGALMRYRFMALGIVFGALLLAGAITSMQTPIYQGHASVLLENRNRKIIADVEIGSYLDREEARAQQILALSRPVIQRAAEMYYAAHKSNDSTLQEATACYDETLVKAKTEGRLLVLEVLNPEPAVAAELANGWMNAFVEESVRRQQASYIFEDEMLYKVLPAAEKDYRMKMDELYKYERDENYDPREALEHPVVRRLADLSKSRGDAQEHLISLQAEAKAFAEAAANPGALPQTSRASKDPSLIALESMILAQHKKVIDLKALFVGNSDEVKKAEQALAELEAQRGRALEGINSQIKADLSAATFQYAELDKLYQGEEKKYEALKGKDANYRFIQSQVDTLKKNYEGLAQRKSTASLAGRVDFSSAQPWERAEVPGRPYRPSWPWNMTFGLFLGLVLASGSVLLRENLDDTVYSSTQLQSLLGLNVMGTVPLLERRWRKEGAYTLAKEHPRAMPVESLRALRSSLAVNYCRNGSGRGAVLLVTSPGEGEGKSFLAANLATLFAVSGKKALLIDMDLYKATLTSRFGFDNQPGLSNLATSAYTLADFARPSLVPNLFLVPAGSAITNPAAAIESQAYFQILEAARSQFDVVVIDAPPILAVADATSIAAHCDAVLVVVRSRITRLTQVDRASEILQRSQAKECVIVLNGLDAADAEVGGYGYAYSYKYGYGGYGYGYGYGRGYGYGYGYGSRRRSRTASAPGSEPKGTGEKQTEST